jgi:hypothetical protein
LTKMEDKIRKLGVIASSHADKWVAMLTELKDVPGDRLDEAAANAIAGHVMSMVGTHRTLARFTEMLMEEMPKKREVEQRKEEEVMAWLLSRIMSGGGGNPN